MTLEAEKGLIRAKNGLEKMCRAVDACSHSSALQSTSSPFAAPVCQYAGWHYQTSPISHGLLASCRREHDGKQKENQPEAGPFRALANELPVVGTVSLEAMRSAYTSSFPLSSRLSLPPPLSPVSPAPVSAPRVPSCSEYSQQSQPPVFRPMRHDHVHGQRDNTPETVAFRLSRGFSANYHGNVFVPRNMSADIPDSENCSVFLTGLPVNISVRQLLGHLFNFGRVYATYINPPEPQHGHLHCAAKVIFFEAISAQKMIHHCETAGFTVRKHVVRAVPNRIKSAPSSESIHASRVLLIYGPPHIVNPSALIALFDGLFSYEVDRIIAHGAPSHTPESALVEFRFSSFRCQSQLAKKALRAHHSGIVDVLYGEDPCALLPSCIPNESFLLELFWGTKTSACALMARQNEQQTCAATLARPPVR